jgi:hypothetical protein
MAAKSDNGNEAQCPERVRQPDLWSNVVSAGVSWPRRTGGIHHCVHALTGADMRQDHGGAGLGHLLADLASTAQTVWFVSEAATTRRVRTYPEKACSCRAFATLRLIRGGK